jgi:hypothetical protein
MKWRKQSEAPRLLGCSLLEFALGHLPELYHAGYVSVPIVQSEGVHLRSVRAGKFLPLVRSHHQFLEGTILVLFGRKTRPLSVRTGGPSAVILFLRRGTWRAGSVVMVLAYP